MRVAVPLLLLFALAAPAAPADERNPDKKGPPSLIERVEKQLKGVERPFTIITQLYIRPGTEREFETDMAKVGKTMSADKGCLGYEFFKDTEKVGHYTLIERWNGPAALRDHLGKDHTKRIQAIFDELSTTPRTTDIYVPVGGPKEGR